MQPNQLDEGAVNLAKSIRDTESKGDFNAKGASGEWGAYQFMPDTWNAYAREAGVNAAFGSATPDQQNEVAYKKIKQWKDQGYNVGQISSMWNAGPGRPDAYKEGWKGTNTLSNGKKVDYDTPTYAEKVARSYQRLKGQAGQEPDAPMPEEGQRSFVQDLSNTASDAGNKLAGAIGDTASGAINPLSGLIRVGGALGAGLGGATTDILHHIPVVGDVMRGAEDVVGKGVSALAQTDAGQNIVKSSQDFAQAHPEIAGDIGAGADILSAIPVFKGLGIAKNIVKGGLSSVLHGAADDVLESVTPNLTPKNAAKAVAQRGTEKKGLLGEVKIKPDPFYQKVADEVRTVKGYSPSKSATDNIVAIQSEENNVRKALEERVHKLGEGRIYSYRELESHLGNIEIPLRIRGDATMRNYFDGLIQKTVEIAKSKGGKVPNLLDVRKELDNYVKREFGDLYSNQNLTPIRQAVGLIRNAITGFTVDNLPKDALLEETLKKQHYLIKGIESLSAKATKGPEKEIGKNALKRFGDRHPVARGLIRTATKAAVEGTGIGTALKILD